MVTSAFKNFSAPEKNPGNNKPLKPFRKKKSLTTVLLIIVAILLILIVVMAIIVIAGYFFYGNYTPSNKTAEVNKGGINKTSTEQQLSEVSNITWQAPKLIDSLEVFNDAVIGEGMTMGYNPSQIAKYYKVGEINGGKYEGGEIILITAPVPGPHLQIPIYRFIKQGSSLIFLKNNSNEIYSDSGFNSSKFSIDEEYRLDELDFPESFIGFNGEKFELDKFVNSFFAIQDLKKVFTDPKLGDVYTSDGFDKENTNLFLRNGFYIQAPDGTVKVYSVKPAILEKNTNIPKITWSDGKTNASDYNYSDHTGCGSANYASVMPEMLVSMDDLKAVGKSASGDNVYELKDVNHPMLKDLYENKYQVGYEEKKVSYSVFVASHPMFFWRDSFDRLLKFVNMKYQPLAECGKPVIYLYPKTPQNINVKVEPLGGMSYSDPAYGNGWTVFADTQSNLKELSSGKNYPYLFWEGKGGIYQQPQKGFVIKKSQVNSFLKEKLAKLGLNKKESADFMEFWEPRMQDSPYYFVTFLGTRDMDMLAPLNIEPKPDTVIRILMDFSPLDKPVQVEGYEIVTPERKGFTVIEWGGVLR